jgi:NAD(P)-dependent dehydrogenase (short-subunit alcohol dehydrogenase family)
MRDTGTEQAHQPVIVITGASQGIGAAMAGIAAGCGVRVVLVARSEDRLGAQAERIREAGGTALPIAADVTRFEDCRRVIDTTVAAFGRIDALINNAGTIEPIAPVARVRHEDWARLIEINLLGPLMMSQLAIPHLRLAGGRLLNVSSVAARVAIPGFSAYSTSKAALDRFSKVLAAEEPAIAVMSFIPGDVDTAMQGVIRAKARGNGPDDMYQWVMEMYEGGKLLPPEKPARAAVALALRAPLDWSGEILEWDDDRVQELI